MAFQLTVREDGWRADVFRQGGCYLVVINFGYDPETKSTFSVMIGLDPLPGGDMEHFFCIIENTADNEKKCYYSGANTGKLFPKETRKLVLSMVLSATHSLINAAQCSSIKHSTHDANLPQKALVKHILIAEVFESCGYVINRPDPYHGRYIWWAERS
jgi:hypothetical protein